MKHSFWKRFLALVMAIAIVLSTGVLDSAGWLLANNGEDTTQEPTGENTTPPSDQQGGSSTETLDLTTEPTVESTGATDPSEGGETEDETTESTPVKEVTLTVVIQSVYADESQEGAVLGTEYLTYAEGEASKTIAVVIPAVEGYTFATDVAMTLNAEGKYEASLSRPAESGMLYITVTYSPIVPEGEEGTEPETPVEGDETVTGPVVNVTVVYAYIGGVKEETSASYTVTFGEEETEKTFSLAVPQDPGYTYMLDTELDYVPAGDNTFVFTFARPEADTSAEICVFYAADTSVGSQDVYEPEDDATPAVDTYKFVVDGADYAEVKVIESQTVLLPAAPQKDGYKFMGWYNGETEYAQAASVTGATYTYTAKFEPGYYVFFLDEENRVKATKLLVENETLTLTNKEIVLDNKNLAITGWKNEAGDVVTSITMGKANVTLTPVLTSCFSVTYNTMGGTFMESDFYYGNEETVNPGNTATTRPGYTFQGWFTDDTYSTNFPWGGKLTESVTVYAKWEASQNTQYTIVYWIENANDTGHTYENSVTATGTTGATITLNSNQLSTNNISSSYRTYFHYNANEATSGYDQGVVIKGDGSSIVNVYFARNSYTIAFNVQGDYDDWRTLPVLTIGGGTYSNTYSFTAKYEEDISSKWPTAANITTNPVRRVNTGSYNRPNYQDREYTFAGINGNWVSKRVNLTADLITNKTNGATSTYDFEWERDLFQVTLHYMLQPADGSTNTANFIDSETYRQQVMTSTTSWNAKSIAGFTEISEDGTVQSSGNTYNIYFYYNRNKYDLIFNNVNTQTTVEDIYYEADISGQNFTPARPSGMDTAYEFQGWYTTEDCLEGSEFVWTNAKMPANNLILYAKWAAPEQSAQIHFDIILENGSTTITVPYGEKIEDHLPEGKDSVADLVQLKQGLTWDGQWLEIMSDGSFKAFFDINAPITKAVRIAPNITSTEKFTVTYDLNGGTGSVTDSKAYYYGAYADVAYASGVTKADSVFLGWQSEDGTVYQPGDKFQVSKTEKLTAVWGAVPKKVSVTHNSNYPAISGLTNTTYTTEAVTENNTTALATLNATGFTTPTGYRFGGWQNAAGKVFAEGASVLVTTSGDNTVYAVWIPLTYNVTYKYEGDVPTNADALPAGTEGVAYGSTFTAAGQPAAVEGYAFEGWKLNGSVVTSFTMPAGNVELVGTWTKMDFTVTYEYTGEVPDGAPAVPVEKNKITMGTDYTVAADPEVDGYTFNGWLKDGKEVTSFEMPASDVTLIGSWTVNQYTVTYMVDDVQVGEVETYDYNALVEIREKYEKEGYSVSDWSITADFNMPAENVVITATTSVNAYGYTVKYQDEDGKTLDADKTASANFGTTITAASEKIDIDGYTYKSGNDITIGTDETKNVITQVYTKRTDLGLKIRYVWGETVIASEVNETGLTYQQEVTREPKAVDGYTPIKSSETITIGTGENVITFYYRKNVTVTANSGGEMYNGQAQTVSGYTASEAAAKFEGITAERTETDAGEYDVTFTKDPVGTVSKDDLYIVTKGENGKLTITKRNVTLTSATDSKQYDGTPLTNGTVTITGDGFATGEGAAWNVTGSQLTVDSSANSFTYTLNEGTNADNYNITKVEGTLTVTDRDAKFEIIVVANSDEFTYDGTEKNVTGFETLTFTVSGQTYTVEGLSASETQTQAGTYTVKITGTAVVRDAAGNDVTGQFIVNKENGELVINKAALTITADNDTKVYDGTALTKNSYTNTALAAGDEIASVTVTGSQTIVGTSANVPSAAVIKNAAGEDVTESYQITYANGTLEVTKKSITITADNATKTYDGTALVKNSYTNSALGTGDKVDSVTVTGSKTAVGTASNVPTNAKIVNANGEDVTDSYTITYVNGTLEVTKRKVTLTSATDSKEYDGTPLTNATVTVTGDGFATGEGATYAVTGSQTLAGTSENKFTYTLNEGTDASNYDIETVFGKLTVTDRTEKYKITVEANSGEYKYDGNEKTASGFKTLEFEVEGNAYTVEGLTASNAQTNAGTYTVEITGTAVVKDAAGNDVTAQFTVTEVDGKLVINKREVTLTSATDSKEYDGTALTNDEVTVSGDGFAANEGATYDVTGSQLTVGSSENEFTYTLNEGTKADNYNINKVEGTLTVTDRDAKFEITVEANSGEFKYDGTEKNVSGFKTLTFTVNGQTYTVEGLSASNTQTDAGTYTVEITGTAVVKDAAGNDVTAQFTVTEVDGKLFINKREVTLTSATDSKEYDGTALTNDEVTVSGDGFAANEGATYDVTGSQLTVGSSENEFTYTLNEGTKADNYNINKVEGTLTVTDRDAKFEIIVVANSDEFTYDGTEKNVTGFETLTFTVSGQTYTVEGLTASETQTQAGTYTVKITGTAVVKDANGNDVTAQFIVNKENGELVINPAEITVTITGNTESKVYNGSEQMVEGYEVEISNKLYTEADFSFSGTDVVKGTDVGTYPMGLAEDQFTNNNDNFTVTFVVTDGQLEITPVTDKVTVTITEHKGTEVYKGDAYTVSGYDVAISNPLYSELDIVFSGTASVSGTVVGTYDMGLKPENFANINENFTNVEFVIVDGQLVINPLEVTVTITENSDSKVYNGAEQKVEGYEVTSISNDLFKEEMIVFTGEAVAKGTFVGTYDMNLTPDQFSSSDAKNFTVTFEIVDGQLEITPVTDKVTVTITEHSGTEKYDGTEKTVTGYDVDIDNELYFEKDFTFSGNATGKGTNAGTYEMALKAADFSNISKNFTNVEFVILDGKLEITKRSVTLTSADDEKVYDGTALTNSEVTVSGDGFVTGEGATYDVTGTQTAEGSSENEFTYTLNANTLADNYDITVEFGTLKVTALTDEIVVTITENSGEYLYDGAEHTVNGYEVTEISNPLYTVNDFTFSGDATVSGTDAGTYEMKLKPEDFTNTSKNFEKVTFVIEDGKLEITKREVTMTSATDTKAYDGTALTNATVTVTGDGFAEKEGATYDVTGTQTENGTSSNTFTYTLNEGTKADNYIIKTVEGTLTVTASQKTVTVTITENSDTDMYDGAEHSVKGYEVTGISDPLYTVNDFSFSGNATVSGTNAGTYEMELKSDDFTNISANFADVEFIIVDGTLVIEKRNVTLTSATDSKVYDGTALTNDTVTVTGDGFAKGEGAAYDVTGTQTEFGTSSNTFTYTLNEGTKADNYIIKTVEGTLTVTAVTDKVTVVITENSGEATYDGTQHTVTGYEVTSISNPLYTVDDFTFSGNAAVNAVDAGVYDMLLTSGNFTNKSPNFANVEFVIVDGQLTINKRNVTLTSASDSKEYDGIALTAKTVEITAGSFAPNEGYTVNITGSQTLVGKSDNTFSYALTQNTKSGNYEITVVYGELQVTDRTEPFVVVVEANSGERVYNGQPFTVSGLKEATVARMAARIDGQTVTFLLNGETYTISGLHAERTETHVNPAAPTAVDVLPYSGYEVAITGTAVITDSEGNDVTKQFTVETISGLLTIHPAPVTMVSGDATKPYDGTELINHEVTATGFMEGEGASYDVTGTQTLVGSSENAFTYTLNEGTQAQDYRIETTFGTLTVTAPEDYEIIDKTHTTETLYRLGDTVTFDITVKNIFSEEAKVVITEQEGVSILWNGQKVQSVETTIPAGETITLQAEYTLQEKDILAGEYTNVVDANIKATVDKIPYEGDDDDDDKVDEIEDPKAKLTLDKVTTSTPANGSKYVVGETITYQITATNSGNLTLHDVVIYDLLTGESQSKYAVETDPVEYTFELDVNLAPGESATVTYTHTVTEEDLGKNLINAVTGSAGNSSETDDEEKNDTPTEIIPDEVKDPTDDIRRDLDVEKNVLNYQDPYRLGSFIEYEIVVTNRGNVTERDVIVTDIVDSRGGAYYLSFTDLGGGLLLPGNRVQIPSIAPGETVTILCHYWIGADDEALPVNNKAVVESADGETGDEDDAETVMVEKLYTLTIYYLTDDWQTVLAPEYHDRYSVGYTYYVESPEIEGYEANYKAIWSGWDGMPEHDVVCYVLYSKLPEETTEPTTEPTDPSEETTEPTTAPTEPTYDLTEIPEEEVPLGDVDLGDHTCCIMHFLIMLVAMILLGFYTKDRKKYQERIHELKRSLAAEDAAAAAAGEEQA